LTTLGHCSYAADVLDRRAITEAYHRLLELRGEPAEKSAIARDMPRELPSEADLIMRTVQEDIKNPATDPAELLAALQLTAQDQSLAEGRELNVVSRLRAKGVAWRVIAQYRGLESAQAAKQRYDRIQRRSAPTTDQDRYGLATMSVTDVMVYAFRIAGDDGAAWHGEPDLLPAGQYIESAFPFMPDTLHPPFSGRTLIVRYGLVSSEVLPGYLRACPLIDNRRIPMTAATQEVLFDA
jgi:hypothetical protein